MRALLRSVLAFLGGTDAPPRRHSPVPHLHFDRARRSWVPCPASETYRRTRPS